ncbi:MAG: flagellar export chaperone FliS [Firmicutes bacterium]|uniref:Flagellar export chaperone FliS n=1 Tax=Candidatus Scybalomonas excrementavium TaxID=2840943 RepID=A0A9D9N809_9FIRM|nr:flagellar export chaperone FliS [Candidatus Scybalomonas excrementavium]
MNLQGYQQYKEQSIYTMTQGELLNLLYDELMKRLLRAEIALKDENFELFDASVMRCREIVQYLKDTLNRKYPISAELSRMYDFFLYELSRISARRDEKVIIELKPLVQDLREAFKEASKQVAN